MDQTWIYRNIHLIISLLLIRTSEISSKEYYCTKAGTWREAMESCTRSGGVPVSYRDVYNSREFTLKDNRNVWTADYIYLEYMTDIAHGKTTEGYECGYRAFGLVKGKHEYYPRFSIFYDRCTATKQYFCYSRTTQNLIKGTSTWDEAFSDCSSHNSFALWNGYTFHWNRKSRNTEMWIRKVRRVTKGTVKGTITIDDNNIENCGTNVEEVKRYNSNNCEEHLESVCVFEDTVNDTDTFTRTCFEGLAGDYIAIVVATISVSLTICCILIGIGLFCYRKQRRQKIDEKNTTVIYVNENLSTTTTGRNPSDTNGSVNDRANAVDTADENYEALGASREINSVDHVHTELNQI